MTELVSKKSIYLGGGWFTEDMSQQLNETDKLLQSNDTVGYIYRPLDHQAQGVQFSQPWRKKTFEADRNAILNSDVVVATLLSVDQDPGTIWEIGYAMAIGKPVLLRYDGDSLNLMLCNSMTLIIPQNDKDLVDDYYALEDINFNALPTNNWLGGSI